VPDFKLSEKRRSPGASFSNALPTHFSNNNTSNASEMIAAQQSPLNHPPSLHPLTGTLNYYQRKKEFENI
jgi:hypothetical protein